MISFFIYWVTAIATVMPVLVLIAFAVWGRPISALEWISIAGSVSLGAGAFVSLYRRRAASVLVLASAFAQWIYLTPALRAAARNVGRGGSYPLRSFIPAVLLLVTTAFAYVEFGRPAIPTSTVKPKLIRVAAVAVVTFFVTPLLVLNPNRTPIDLFVMRRVVSVPMRWHKRIDVYAQPDHYDLEYDRKAGTCGTEFWGHPDLAKYIESFTSNKPIPVTYEVYYDNDGEAVSANFMRVGNRAASCFGANEGLLSRGGLVAGPGMPPIVSHNPQDCFDQLP
jgi:hypothetical protein